MQPSIVPLTRIDEIAEASELYRRVFGYVDPATALNPKLLVSMARHGGVCLGARDAAGSLIAFSYGWTGLDDHVPFHYSQSTVVDQAWQGRGLGRAMKNAQRQQVLDLGMTQMRWSYDPMLSRNGHFNLDVLGARSLSVVPDMFAHGEHRVIVGWDLTRHHAPRRLPTVVPAEDARPGEGVPLDQHTAAVVIPHHGDPDLARRLIDTLVALHDRGWWMVSCPRLDPDRSAYLLHRDQA